MEAGKIMDIIAYFLSKYDETAVLDLGYQNRSESFHEIGRIFGKKPNYLKRLRDEYDVLTGSHRNGQRNRPARQRIIDTCEYFATFAYEELLDIVNALIMNEGHDYTDESEQKTYDVEQLSEEEMEYIMNFRDPEATVKKFQTTTTRRVCNVSIIKRIKNLYKGKCQICGERPFDTDICEVHHINYFSESHDNNATNLLVLCPNHHRLLHKKNPTFDINKLAFVFDDGTEMAIALNMHLE